MNGHAGIVQELLKDRRADMNAKNDDGRTSLFLATAEGHLKILRELLKH